MLLLGASVLASACSVDRIGLGEGDAGPDASCTASIEECNGRDDDCDGEVDEDFDRMSDPENCGGCGVACPTDPAHGASTCFEGECQLACDSGFADCDGDVATGCEASLGSPATCGSCDERCEAPTPLCESGGGGYSCVASCSAGRTLCGDRCVDTSGDVSNCGGCGEVCPDPAHGSPACTTGACTIGSCDEGWDDCNGLAGDGCETSLRTVTDCGSCGVPCDPPGATGSCTTGACAIGVCDALFGDCDSMLDNGCEQSLETLSHCGMCSRSCALDHATESCAGGTCAVTGCDDGWDDCDSDPDNGCEADLSADGDCGGCGVTCTLAHATASCGAAGCEIASCDAGWDDCDSNPSNGCETDLSADGDCGACGVTCALDHATASCGAAGCEIASCDAGWDDCDSDSSTGCETELGTDAACASCSDSCGAGEVCAGGTCTSCPSGCECTGTCGTTGSTRCSCTAGCPCSYQCDTPCEVSCSGNGTECDVDGVDLNSDMDVTCASRATCRFDGRGQSNVRGTCTGAMTDCVFDCRPGPSEDTSNCDQIRCEMGASCRIQCGSTSNCGFEFCHADERTCAGWVTCNTGSCP